MVLWLRSADDEAMRLGVVASKKAGKAVQRVRAKRLLREAFRINRHRFEGTRDVVLVARRGLSERDYAEVERELLNLARKAGLLRTSE